MGTEEDCKGWRTASFLLLLIMFGAEQWSEETQEIRRSEKEPELKGQREFTRGKKMKVRVSIPGERAPGHWGKGDCRRGRAFLGGEGTGRGHTL